MFKFQREHINPINSYGWNMWQPFERLWQFKSLDGRKRVETKSTLTCWPNLWTCFNSIFCSKRVQSQKLLLEHKDLRYVGMSFRLVVDLLCKSFLVRLTVLQVTHRKEMRGAIKSGIITWLWLIFWNTFRFQWKWFRVSECWNRGVCLRCFVSSAETSPRNVCKQFSAAWMNARCRPSLLLTLLSCFQHFKLKSSEMHIQKNPTSNSLLHCLKFSSRDTTWSPKKMPCRPTGILCLCQQSSSPKASWLPIGINQRKVEKSLWKTIEFAAQVNQQKVLESCQLLETSQSVSSSF